MPFTAPLPPTALVSLTSPPATTSALPSSPLIRRDPRGREIELAMARPWRAKIRSAFPPRVEAGAPPPMPPRPPPRRDDDSDKDVFLPQRRRCSSSPPWSGCGDQQRNHEAHTQGRSRGVQPLMQAVEGRGQAMERLQAMVMPERRMFLADVEAAGEEGSVLDEHHAMEDLARQFHEWAFAHDAHQFFQPHEP